MRPQGRPWPVLRRTHAGLFHRQQRVPPIRAKWFEQLEHAIIICPRFSRQHPRDHVRKVIVTDRERITIPICLTHHDSGCPRTNTAHRKQTTFGMRCIHPTNLRQATRPTGHLDHRGRPLAFNAVIMQFVI